jgi:hypothetical protein
MGLQKRDDRVDPRRASLVGVGKRLGGPLQCLRRVFVEEGVPRALESQIGDGCVEDLECM